MSKFSILGGFPTAASNKTFTNELLRVLVLAAISLVLTLGTVLAADTDEEYLKIFNTIEQADTLLKTGDSTRALVKYREAAEALKSFRHDNPGWNPKLVNYRWNDLASKIAVAQDAAASGGAKPAAASTADAPKTTIAVKPAATTTAPQLKLLQAGSEPRKVLRLAPKAGDKQTMGLTMKMGIEMKMGEMEVPAMNIPAISMDMIVTIKEVSSTGDITYDMNMGEATMEEDPNASEQVAAAMKGSLDSFKGMSGTCRMSSRGISLGADMKAPDGANPQVRQTIDQMKDSMDRISAPLPEEAVGPGARWEAKTTVKSQGMTINQAATYELVSIEGDRVTIKSTITQNAANQKISNPSMPGMKVEVAKMNSKGGGNATWELSRILPVEGTMDVKSEMTMGVPTGGEQQTMNMNMDMSLKLQSK